ncbi:MAG: hypothetical protein NT108_03250 [Candidatus Kaiserbacteria bacterium]|nr:hypothetical protein [Candidatus Kaiserbacteria bacterium]
MSEKLPENEHEKFQKSVEVGFELQRQDAEDSERGPIVRRMRAIVEKARENYEDNVGFLNDLASFRESWNDHFTVAGARRYRLYHLMTGSSPLGSAIFFDAEGEWSIAKKVQELAEKHTIRTEEV